MASNMNQEALEINDVKLRAFQNAINNLNNKIVQERLLQRYSIESNFVEIQRDDVERVAMLMKPSCEEAASQITVVRANAPQINYKNPFRAKMKETFKNLRQVEL